MAGRCYIAAMGGIATGSLFAVYPLHTEAVGWLAAQWDLWATMFGLLGLWLYSMWWRRGARSLYALALLCFFLGVFSKREFTDLAAGIRPFCVGDDTPVGLTSLRRVVLSLLPFVGVLILNVGLRLLTWGNLGGYPDATTFAPLTTWTTSSCSCKCCWCHLLGCVRQHG